MDRAQEQARQGDQLQRDASADVQEQDFALQAVTGCPIVLKNAPQSTQQIQRKIIQEHHMKQRRIRGENAEAARQMAQTLPIKGESVLKWSQHDGQEGSERDDRSMEQDTTTQHFPGFDKKMSTPLANVREFGDEDRTGRMSAHKDYRAETVAEFQQFELDDKSSKQTERASISLKKKQDHTQSGTVSPGEIYRPRFQQQRDVLAHPKRHQMSDTFNQDLKMHMNLHTTKAKKGSKIRLNNPSFLSRHSRRRSPRSRRGSQAGSNRQDAANVEGAGLQKSPPDLPRKELEDSPVAHEEKLSPRSPGVRSSQHARDYWHSDHLEMYPVHNQSVYFSNKLQDTTGTEVKDYWTGTENKELGDAAETMRKDSMHPGSSAVTNADGEQRQIAQMNQMYEVINSEVKIVNSKGAGDTTGHELDGAEGTLLKSLRLRQMPFMESANSDLAETGVPAVQLRATGKINWNQLTEESQVELLKALQHIETFFPKTKAGFHQLQKILSVIEGIPGISEHNSNSFSRQKSFMIEKMKRVEAEKRRNRLESAKVVPEPAAEGARQSSSSKSPPPRVISQTMNMYLQTISNQQKKMNTDPSKWMPHGQMLHPKMNYKSEERSGQRNKTDKTEAKRYLAPSNFKVTMQKRILSQRIQKPHQIAVITTNEAPEEQQQLSEAGSQSRRRSTIQGVRPGEHGLADTLRESEAAGYQKGSALTQHPLQQPKGSSDARTSSPQQVTSAHRGMRVTGNFGSHEPRAPQAKPREVSPRHGDFLTEEKTWDDPEGFFATSYGFGPPDHPTGGSKPSGLRVHQIPGVQNEISVQQLNAIKEEDKLTKAFQDGAMTVQKAVITPINLHELMMVRADEATPRHSNKPTQTRTPRNVTPEEDGARLNSQMNNQMNQITKFSSSGAHVSSIQNIGMTSMHTQSRDVFGTYGAVATHPAPGSSDTLHHNKVTLDGRVVKVESDSMHLQGRKPGLVHRPAGVDASERDLPAAVYSKGTQSGRDFGSPSPSFFREPASSILLQKTPGQVSSPKMLNREANILVKNQRSQSSGELKSQLVHAAQNKGYKGMEERTHITEAIHEESASQANTPNINAKANVETSPPIVHETISKDTSRTFDKPASTTKTPPVAQQQQFTAIKPVLQPIINIPQARRDSSKNDIKQGIEEPQVLNLGARQDSKTTPKAKNDYDDGHVYRARKVPHIPLSNLSSHIVGKELCKSGSVDDKANEKQIRYFNEHRQMQMTPRQKKHLDYLAKKNGANAGSDYQERTPRRQAQTHRHGSSTFEAASKSNKGLSKYKGDNEDISQLLDEDARTDENKSKRSQVSYSPRHTDGKSGKESRQNDIGTRLLKDMDSGALHRDPYSLVKSIEDSRSAAPERASGTTDARQRPDRAARISTANMSYATAEKRELDQQHQAIEAVIVAGVHSGTGSDKHKGSAEFGGRSSGQTQDQAYGLAVANIMPQDERKPGSLVRREVAGASHRPPAFRVNPKNDAMNQTFGDLAACRDPLTNTNDNFKFPLRGTEQSAQRLATQKRASLVEQLYIRNCNRENRYETFYQGRFKRAEQHKAMVKLEQKRQRRRLAAQNRDMQDHLKEMLPPSRDFSADLTETQSISLDTQLRHSVAQTQNASPESPLQSSQMGSQMPPLKFGNHFGNRKKTLEAVQPQKLTDGFQGRPPISQQLLANTSDNMQSSRTESMPPIMDRTAQSKYFESALPTQGTAAAPSKPEMSIVEQDMEHLRELSTLMPTNGSGRNAGSVPYKGQMNATSPTFTGLHGAQTPQELAALTPIRPLNAGGQDGQIIVLHNVHDEAKRQSPHDESRRSRYDELDSQGSQVDVPRESLIEGLNVEQAVTDYGGHGSMMKAPTRAPFMYAENVDANELSNELEDIILKKKFKENQEKHGLLPAVKNAHMTRTIHDEHDLFKLIGTDDIVSSRETLNLKMQLKMLKNLNLKEKLHYQRLITHNTKNKNFNLTENNPGNQWLRANMTATTGFGGESNSLGLPSTKKKGKKDIMTFRLRKLSEINNEEIKAVAKPAVPERRMSLYTQMPDAKPEEHFDLKSVGSHDEGTHRALLPEMRNAGFNKTVQVFNAANSGQRPTMPFIDTMSNTQSHIGNPGDKAGGLQNFATLMNQSIYRAPFDPNRTQYSVTFQDVHKFKGSREADEGASWKQGLKQRPLGANQRMPKILRQLSNQRGDVVGYVRNDKKIQTHRHMSVQPADSAKIYGLPHKTGRQASKFNKKLCNQDLEKVMQVQKTMDKIGHYFGEKSLEGREQKYKSDFKTTLQSGFAA